jgi:hypothetical protein
MMTPDRRPESIHTEASPMADEIAPCNVVRFEKHGYLWKATIGPAAPGLDAWGNTPRQAMALLMTRCEALAWVWDETWRDPQVT